MIGIHTLAGRGICRRLSTQWKKTNTYNMVTSMFVTLFLQCLSLLLIILTCKCIDPRDGDREMNRLLNFHYKLDSWASYFCQPTFVLVNLVFFVAALKGLLKIHSYYLNLLVAVTSLWGTTMLAVMLLGTPADSVTPGTFFTSTCAWATVILILVTFMEYKCDDSTDEEAEKSEDSIDQGEFSFPVFI